MPLIKKMRKNTNNSFSGLSKAITITELFSFPYQRFSQTTAWDLAQWLALHNAIHVTGDEIYLEI